MFNNYNIMLNIKNLFITTGLSVLFGVYSIYAFIEYLKFLDKINKNYTLEFDNIHRVINVIHNDHNDLSLKYNIIETKYNELNAKYDELYVKNVELTIEYDKLNKTHNELLNNFLSTHINEVDSLDEPDELEADPEQKEQYPLVDSPELEYSQQLQTVNEMSQYKINYSYDYDDREDDHEHAPAFYNEPLEQQPATKINFKTHRPINYDDVHINKIIQENFMEPEFIDTLNFDYDNVKTDYNRVKQSNLINYPYEDVPSLNSSYSSLSNLSQHSGNSYSKPENYKVLVRSRSTSVIGDLWIGLTQKFF